MSAALTEDLPDIDNPQKQEFVKFFRGLDFTDDRLIRLFEREANGGCYYTAHGRNAEYIAEHVYKTTTVIQHWFGDSIPTVKLTNKVAENFLRDALLKQQLKIEIWKYSQREWKIIQKASPGNIQEVEEYLFSSVQMMTAPVVMAIRFTSQGDNKAQLDDTTMKQLGISEFMDNESYSNLESLIIQLGVKECLSMFYKGDYEYMKIQSLLDRCGVILTECRKSEFDSKNIEQDLNRLLQNDISVTALPEYGMKEAMSSCACIIKYLQLLEDDSNYGKYSIRNHDLSQYMKLDGSAVLALNLMPASDEALRKTSSLYGLLNQCKTAQGSRLFAQWLKQPLLNLSEINKRHDIVEVFYENTELRQLIQEDHLRGIPDLHRISKRFQKGNANLQDVLRIYQVIIRLPSFIDCLNNHIPSNKNQATLIQSTYIESIAGLYNILQRLEELVENSIDLKATENHEYIIKADLNEELQALHSQMEDIYHEITDEHKREGRNLDLEVDIKLKLEKHNIYGYCLRIVGRKEYSRIRNKPGYIEYATQKTGTLIATKKLRELSDKYSRISKLYEAKQKDLVKEVLDIVATYCPQLEQLGGIVAHLDVLVSFAHVSIMAPTPYVRPVLTPAGQGNVILKEARHPCLEVQDYVSFIPNDVEMIRDNSEFQIITGPNMGGKSTYIRQIGVIALMAQIGCFVPCTEANLCMFDSILARVGAGDSQLKGVSTFMAEMLETAAILRSSTCASLVIIDELGRGTSTSDGLGIAWALSEHIATQIRCFCLFATHFHELTELEKSVKTVKNLHVEVHIGTERDVTLLYRVNEGVGDKSFGIHVAKLANLPPSVIKLAKNKAHELDVLLGEGDDKAFTEAMIHDGDCIMKDIIADIVIQGNNDMNQTRSHIMGKYQSEIENNPYLRKMLMEDCRM
ncbi:putative DNA mismatch repair protein MSH2 [Pilobolus umbonatus]|nr:putative DNA mismatch repair protein MSH2 [Pilobolus umbonatus]